MRTTLSLLIPALLALTPAAALAQPSGQPLPFMPPVQTTPIEVSLGLSINFLTKEQFGGFGLDTSVALNKSTHRATVGAIHLHEQPWPSGATVPADSEMNNARALLIGTRLQSNWLEIPGFSRDPARFYVQALAGIGASTAQGAQPVVQIGVGVDSVTWIRRRYSSAGEVTLRMSFDYRFTPFRRGDLRGGQFGIALVIGPHR